MKTVRFWIYWNGLVRLTLSDKHKIHIHKSQPTDEGYSYRAETYELVGDFVRREVIDGGCDCDGRLDRYAEYECHVSELDARYRDDELYMPNWKLLDASQRDYTAEAMGY